MSWRPAATTTTPASSSRGRALTRRIADYFGLSYPHEFTSAASLLTALIFLRAVTIAHYKFALDESQHLHVVWGWARGFVQYRDLADNHMPLFQILCAPIYKLIGDRGTILYWMRIILQPRLALIAVFLMGLCFGVSMKTLLLVMSTVIGGSMTLIFVGRERLGIGWGQILGALTAFFATTMVVPAAIMAAFALYGIWPQ